jgi:hypothetical protein
MFGFLTRRRAGKRSDRDASSFSDPTYRGPESKKSSRRGTLTRKKSATEGTLGSPSMTKQREQVIDKAISVLETQILYKNLQEKAVK